MSQPSYRWTIGRVVVAAASLALTAWASYSIYDNTLGSPSEALAQQGSRTRGDGREALLREYDLSKLTIDKAAILHGGPFMDGIPSLTTAAARPAKERTLALHGPKAPAEVAADKADFLKDDDRVVGLTIEGESKAYPIKLLNWHEIINDVVGGVPVAIIYCPLCDSVSVVDRRFGDKTLEFGVSGLLHNSNVILYDRTDKALWSQEAMGAISGPHAGQPLKHPWGWQLGPFAAWKKEHPDSMVLTFDTGYQRPYTQGAYQEYFVTDRLMFPVGKANDRFANKTPIIGVSVGDEHRAYPLNAIHGAPDGVLRDTLGGGEVVLRSLEAGHGVAIDKVPDRGRAIHTFWFAWYAFHPDTQVYTRAGGSADSKTSE